MSRKEPDPRFTEFIDRYEKLCIEVGLMLYPNNKIRMQKAWEDGLNCGFIEGQIYEQNRVSVHMDLKDIEEDA